MRIATVGLYYDVPCKLWKAVARNFAGVAIETHASQQRDIAKEFARRLCLKYPRAEYRTTKRTY